VERRVVARRRVRWRIGTVGRVEGMLGWVESWAMFLLEDDDRDEICSIAIVGKRDIKRSGRDFVV